MTTTDRPNRCTNPYKGTPVPSLASLHLAAWWLDVWRTIGDGNTLLCRFGNSLHLEPRREQPFQPPGPWERRRLRLGHRHHTARRKNRRPATTTDLCRRNNERQWPRSMSLLLKVADPFVNLVLGQPLQALVIQQVLDV